MRVVIATGNPDKVKEFEKMLAHYGLPVYSAKELGLKTGAEETGTTFAENALIKCRSIPVDDREETIVFADDSGLCVDALGGEPGIYSSRYLGEDTPYEIKNAHFIKLLENVPDEKRTCRYHCAIAVRFPDGTEAVAEDTMEGRIAYEPAGNNGFGYDPVFYLPEYNRTCAELDPEVKNRISHRGKAMVKAEKLIEEWLKNRSAQRYDAVALGEALIDFTECGRSESGMRLFEQNPGGAPANFLTALSHCSAKTALLTKVGCDMHGDFLVKVLDGEGIETSYIRHDPSVFTTLAFVALDDNGERTFSFARKPGADTCLSGDELPEEVLKKCKVFHFGSLTLIDEPVRSATLEALRIAKEAGAVITFDPNYRDTLWPSKEAFSGTCTSLLGQTDVLKVSDEESLILTGCSDVKEAARILLSYGPKTVLTTLGADGVLVNGREVIPAYPVDHVVDTTGAGDTFFGSFVAAMLEYGKRPEEMSEDEICRCARFGNRAASLCITKRGGIPSIPWKDEIVC